MPMTNLTENTEETAYEFINNKDLEHGGEHWTDDIDLLIQAFIEYANKVNKKDV